MYLTYILFFLGALLFFPKIFLFIYVYIRAIGNFKKYKNIIFFDTLVFFYFSLSLSIMLADRPYYIGEEVGFGEDMLHYYNAFYWIINNDFLTFIKDFTTITNLTGSAEPLFWLTVKLFSFFTESEYVIHVLITLLGCSFIYLSGQIWKNCGLLFLFFYTNTITFFAFQGSAIRSGLAFSVAMLGYSLFLKNKFKIITFLSPLFHFSMIPMPLIIYASDIEYKNKKKLIKLFFISLVLMVAFSFLALKSSDAGLGAKLAARFSESQMDLSSVVQFFIESIFTMLIIFYLFKNKVDTILKKSFIYFFALTFILLLFSPTAFSRFYRYEYIFMIFIYSSIFIKSDKCIKIVIIFVSLLWFLFLGLDRFSGIFSENIVDFIGYNLIYRFK